MCYWVAHVAHEQLSKTVRTRFLYISLTQKSAKWLRASKKSPSLVNLTASLAPRRVLRTNSKTKATQHLHNIVSKPSRSTLECERRVSNVLGNVTALSNALAELILVSNPHTLVETKCRSAFQIWIYPIWASQFCSPQNCQLQLVFRLYTQVRRTICPSGITNDLHISIAMNLHQSFRLRPSHA